MKVKEKDDGQALITRLHSRHLRPFTASIQVLHAGDYLLYCEEL
jgi:hypothetical protein